MKGLEIERKFLIRQNTALFENAAARKDITQTYLNGRVNENGEEVQRRVRRIVLSGSEESIRYYYTEKVFVSPKVRKEKEREIGKEEYDLLLRDADPALLPVEKSRYIINHGGLVFEADVYPFSESFATIEAELPSEDTPIEMPPFIDAVREVTGDSRYSNTFLSTERAFPEDREQHTG